MFGKYGYVRLKYDKGGSWRNGWYGYSTVDVVGEGCSCWHAGHVLTFTPRHTEEMSVLLWTVSKTLQKELLLVNIKNTFYLQNMHFSKQILIQNHFVDVLLYMSHEGHAGLSFKNKTSVWNLISKSNSCFWHFLQCSSKLQLIWRKLDAPLKGLQSGGKEVE